jgi:chemotaxis methyl-accepting protein methylase
MSPCLSGYTISKLTLNVTTSVPPNCSFEIDDLEKDWTWSQPFDLIFCRSMIASFVDWPSIIAKAYQ